MAGKRRRRTREEMASWLAVRELEGLTLRELSQRSRIPVGTLSWWCHRFRQEGHQATDDGGFCEVVVEDEGPQRMDPSLHAAIRIHLRSGHIVELGAGFDTEAVGHVLEILEHR